MGHMLATNTRFGDFCQVARVGGLDAALPPPRLTHGNRSSKDIL